MTNDSIQVIEYDTGNTLMLNRRTIISATSCKVYPSGGAGKMIEKVRVRCFSGLVYTLDMEPTVSNLRDLMP